jgi:hypothetical protein
MMLCVCQQGGWYCEVFADERCKAGEGSHAKDSYEDDLVPGWSFDLNKGPDWHHQNPDVEQDVQTSIYWQKNQ